MTLTIDSFCHIITPKFKEILLGVPKLAGLRSTIEDQRAHWDLDYRFKIMDRYPGYLQILSQVTTPIEAHLEPKEAIEIARIGNDEMAELVLKYPQYFIAAVATLPMNDMDAALDETDRAIQELNFKGILIWTPTNGKPLDSPEFMPLYEKMSQYNLPIIIHPTRPTSMADYPAVEKESKYRMSAAWGWPYETTLAMTRLVFAGVLEKYPDLKILTHHAGGMVPYLSGRIKGYWDMWEVRHRVPWKQGLRKPLIDYFHMFYCDTAVYDNTAALMCADAFFGTDHVLYGSDMPYDSQSGERQIRETIEAVGKMDISDSDKKKIMEDNARSIFRLPI